MLVDPPKRPRAATRQSGAAAGGGGPDDDDDGDDGVHDQNQGQLWDRLKLNRIVCFILRGDNPSHLRTAEVINLASDKRSGEFWYWIDHAGTYHPGKPLEKRRLTAEWADERGKTRVKPKPAQAAVWAPRQHTLSIEDIEIISPVINVRVGGTVAPDDVKKVDTWLKKASRTDARAKAAISVHRLGAEEQRGPSSSILRSALMQAAMRKTCAGFSDQSRSNTACSASTGGMTEVMELCDTTTDSAEQPTTITDAELARAHRSILNVFARWDPWSSWHSESDHQCKAKSRATQIRELLADETNHHGVMAYDDCDDETEDAEFQLAQHCAPSPDIESIISQLLATRRSNA